VRIKLGVGCYGFAPLSGSAWISQELSLALPVLFGVRDATIETVTTGDPAAGPYAALACPRGKLILLGENGRDPRIARRPCCVATDPILANYCCLPRLLPENEFSYGCSEKENLAITTQHAGLTRSVEPVAYA
jgi:hypothetical protein